MGTFTITRTGHAPARQKRLCKRHLDNGFKVAGAHSFQDWTITFYTRGDRSNSSFHDLGEAGFIGIAGSLIYNGSIGEIAARKLHAAFDGKSVDWLSAYGSYTIIIKKFGRLFVFADRLGLNKIYLDSSRACISNSFISILDQIDHCTPDPVGCHLYAWLSVMYGDRTFVNEIKPAPPNALLEVGESIETHQLPVPIDRSLHDWKLDFEDATDLFLQRQRKMFSLIATHFGNRVNCSLSGGYDSRLVFSLLLDAGIKPKLYVYGPASDLDVIIAKQLASIAGQELDWIDKESEAIPSPDLWAERLEQCSFALDGWANEGLLSSGPVDMDTRLSRTGGDHVLLLGTAGEVFRNFFYLPDKAYNLAAFVRAIFMRIDPAACGPEFSSENYVAALVSDIHKVIGSDAAIFDRRQIELIYPLLRARHMFGRDMALNQRFGWAFSPFLEPAVFEGAQNIPLKFKTLGNLERRMIQKLNPDVAACQSAYGYPFSKSPPLMSQLRYYALDHYRPLWVRARSYQVQNRKRQALPPPLRGSHLKAIIDIEFPYMRGLFNIERVYDAEVMHRIVTMEYTLQRASGGR